VHPIDGAMGQAFVLTKTPVRKGACVVIEYNESERRRTYGLACPSPDVNPKEHV